MFEHVLVMMLFSIVEAKMTQSVETNTYVPKLEINQREYSNPNTIKKNLSKHLTVEDEVPTAIQGNTLVNEQPNEVNKGSEAKNPSQGYDNMDSIWQETRFLDFGLKDDVISASSYNVPNIPSKFIGPRPKPFKQPKFRGIGPKGIDEYDKPSCNEFSRTARFNPYSVINQQWFNFYRWDSNNVPLIIEFFIPTSWEIISIREFLDKQVDSRQAINWDSRMLLMNDLIYNISGLLVERDDHGRFWMYPIRPNHTESVEAHDVRFKQTADNRFIAFVLCEDDRAYIFSRINEVPLRTEIPDAVATVGWRGRDGRSYLYQGHNWSPVPEIDEEEYWAPRKYLKEVPLPPPPETYDPSTDNVEIFTKNTLKKP